MAKGKRKEKRFLAFLCILTILITTIIPTNITYAATSQYEEVEGDITSENEGNSTEVEPADEESQEGCVLDDGLSIFDTYAQNVPFVAAYEECTPQEKKVVNEVVVFISFSDLGENIYEERGGYDYILNMFDGGTPSLKSYVDEYSWGQVEVNTTAWPQNSNGTALCYVDDHPASYYLKQTSSNPNGYTSTQKSSRRSELLNKAIAFMGDDFLEKMGIEDEPYNLVFMVPKCGSWNDLLWSHKSTITVDGKSTIYNMITYETKEKYITRTITHEFMHSLGFPDLYRYYTDTSANPVSLWSIMGSTSATVGHPLVYEKNKYGDWLGEGNGIKTIKKSGHYELKPSTSDPDENTIAYQIPVEGVTNQYFMVEYRGHSSSGYDTALGREGLIFYRINTNKKGNGYGPPDEIYVLRNTSNVYHAYLDGSEGKAEFSDFYLYEDTTELGIFVTNSNFAHKF